MGERQRAEFGSRHLVYMMFRHREGWCCEFLESDLKTLLPRKLQLADADQILAMATQSGCRVDNEQKRAFDYAIRTGRGGLWLKLDDEQYQRLQSAA